MSQNTVIYLAVDKDGTEWVCEGTPERASPRWLIESEAVELPTGTIKKLTGKPLTWEDGYRVYTGENYDNTNE